MKYLLVLWIGAQPVMHEFNTLAECEQVRRYAIKHENVPEVYENGKKFTYKNVRDSICIKLNSSEGK